MFSQKAEWGMLAAWVPSDGVLARLYVTAYDLGNSKHICEIMWLWSWVICWAHAIQQPHHQDE